MNTIFEILFYEVQYRHRYPSYRLHVHSQSFSLGAHADTPTVLLGSLNFNANFYPPAKTRGCVSF